MPTSMAVPVVLVVVSIWPVLPRSQPSRPCRCALFGPGTCSGSGAEWGAMPQALSRSHPPKGERPLAPLVSNNVPYQDTRRVSEVQTTKRDERKKCECLALARVAADGDPWTRGTPTVLAAGVDTVEFSFDVEVSA